jgi:NitT/TauT family transport system substrate-binding protein
VKHSRALAATVAAALLAVTALSGCNAREKAAAVAAATVSDDPGTAAATLRLGYFANITHAPAILAVADGDLAKQLGTTKLTTSIFNAGPAEVTALLGGSIDAAFVGPSPAINAFGESKGGFVIVAGAMSGGAELVTKPSITTVAELKGTKIATPQLGNTQDVAARAFLTSKGFTTNTTGGGDVHLVPAQKNSQILTEYASNSIDGAWVPEPYASELVAMGAHVLVDERSLWPGGRFTTTVLVVNKAYLLAHGQTVKALIQSELDADQQLSSDPSGAEATINKALPGLGGKSLTASVLTRAFSEITPTVDPIASSLATEQAHAVAAGLVTDSDLHGIFQLTQLDALLTAAGQATVSTGGY